MLRRVWPPAAIAAALFLGIGVSTWPNEKRLGLDVIALLLPSLLLSIAPMALAVGVGWTLARDRSGSRAAVGVGLLSGVLSFAFFDVVVTRSNQAYRVASYQATTGRSETLSKGSREMTFRELGVAAALVPADLCPGPATGKCSCAQEASPTFLRTEWHNRLSLPASGFSLLMLAAVLSRFGSRIAVVLGIVLIQPPAALVLRIAGKYSAQGDLPVALAAWSPPLVLLAFAVVLLLAMRRHKANRAAVPI